MSSLLKNQQSIETTVDFDPFAEGELLLTAPATESQTEIWASVQMGSDANCAYNESQTLRLRGVLAVESLRSALQQLVLRHEALRTTISPDGTTLCIAESLVLEVPEIDLSGLNVAERETKVAQLRLAAVELPFNLEHGPLFRSQIVKLDPEEHLVIITAHHIICDGWSWAVMMPDLGNLYSALKQGEIPDLAAPERFSTYAIDRADAVDDEESIATEAYWLEQFAGAIPLVDLPTDRPRPPLRTFNSAREDWDLSPILVANLKQLGTKFSCSFMTTLLSGFEVWLYRLTGQEDLVVGVSAAGQAASELYNLVGHCVNLLPLRSQVDGTSSFSEYLQTRRLAVLDAYDRQQFTFGSLVQKLAIPRDASRIPLAPVLLNIDRALDTSQLPFDGLEVELYSNPRTYENFELFVNATEFAGKVTLECQYNTNLFDAETIQRRMAELETLLEGMVADPDRSISTLPLLPVSEQNLLAEWNQTGVSYSQASCIHQLVEAQVDRTPDEIAVSFENQHLTYRELNQKANQLAHYLCGLGVKPETLVGICCDRSLDMVLGVLGILKAGGAYVPLDPAYPQERIAFMADDARVHVLLTQSHLQADLPPSSAQIVCLDRDWNAISEVNNGSQPPITGVTAANLAYIIYTSGSTGKPKGVQIQHGSVVNLLESIRHQPGLTDRDTLLSVTTLSFDIASSEVFLPLIVGARLVLVSRDVAADGIQLIQAMEDAQATFMQPTPATWRLLLESGWEGSPNLKMVSTGEALPRDLADRLLPKGKELWNLYGPTETTIWSAGYQLAANGKPITIGQPIANTQLYILDRHLQPVPIGVPGELHIGGAGIARGYLNRPELTAEKFIPNPFSSDPDARLYKTGDLARWLPAGEVECLGRIDYQVKVRGFRIELGEIEANLLKSDAIKEAIVIVREDTPGEKVLVGYFVPATGTVDTAYAVIPELRQFLKASLPDFMVPTIFMVVEAMPLTPNGKVDRQALPKPDAVRRELAANYLAPRSEMEQEIANIWAEVLKVERIGIYDNFFELGGYSLLAIQIVSRMRKAFSVEILLPTLFEIPTIADLAARIETLRWVLQEEQFSQTGSDYEEGEL
ncbi:non-ribosomal peptide synthetase [Chamaesiphon polymorphus]|uniref:Non-ribosomal peptide synthetase n=1 Tax=Chamaesiphon polymorphus CCALA 037 TaxID=2107692 RepID=A0A2T1GMT6_9CYAN|nr:non-ribosomal peptide synthetase [Chamaesiphon polymorphus]PSB59231.1 non-ribosomal peptide synthetase [Chamaesiphon polymorphus CCALA 037]